MIEKLVIIFALIYAFHGVVDGSAIISDDGNDRLQPCFIGWYDEMMRYCAETGKLI